MNLKKKEKILIAGGTGLIGKHIVGLLDQEKYEIHILSRKKRSHETIQYHLWDLSKGIIEPSALENVDYIINLAGAGIADKRWTKSRKEEIINSRIESNTCILECLQEMNIRPKAYISASAIGYYGDRGDEILTEESSAGTSGFLASTTTAWEEAIQSLESQFERTVTVRVGLVLSTKGGALQKMLEPAQFGSAAYFGKGDQYYAWIHIDDISKIFVEAVENEEMNGVYNGVNPNPIPVKEISIAIKESTKSFNVVHSVPTFVLKMMLGEMASMLFNSARVVPKALKKHGFKFKFEDINAAIRDLIETKR